MRARRSGPRGALLAAGALLGAALLPVGLWEALPPVCPSRWLGYRCPGCGMTRALALLLHGHWRRALAHNPRVLVVAPLLLWLAWGQPLPHCPARLGSTAERGATPRP